MKKLAFGILCVASAVLLMSHNSLAAEVVFDAQVKVGNFPSLTYYCATNAAQGYYTSGQCNQKYWISNAANQIRYDSGNTSVAGMKFFTPSGYSGVYNDLVQFEFDIMQGSGAANNAIDISLITLRSNTSNFDVIDVSADRISNNTTHVKVLLWAKGNFSSNTPIILIPANVETANSNYYETNFAWFRETGDLISGGLVNVFHIRSSGGQQFDDTNIVESLDEVKEAIENSSTAESEATENISNQTPSDISSSGNTENSASTNLIGAFSSFVNALTNLQTGDCNITLAFPAYAGGSQTVNICQNKDKAGNLISVFSSLTLIVFYIPLAIRLLTMIYNEIRSFTNG